MSWYPAFGPAELDRRRAALAGVLAGRGAGAALVYGADRSGTAIQWLTGWPVTREAALVFAPDEPDEPDVPDVLYVCYDNHVPNARRLATRVDVRPGGSSALRAALPELAARAASSGRAAVIGPVPARWHDEVRAVAGQVEFLDPEYTALRLVKSAAEIGWLRQGARLTDAGVTALAAKARPGMTEAALGALVESGYVAAGGQTQIRYLGITAMDQPELCVPAQWPSSRPLQFGDVLTCEISASYGGYPGQLLRTFAVGAPPTPRYQELHRIAEQAFDAMTARLRPGATAADLIQAASLITAAGCTIYDDLVHGYGGGYLPPVLTRAALERQQAPDFTFQAGMTVVIQPNVITKDERAGVQTGELVLVTDDGWEPLHDFPRGFGQI